METLFRAKVENQDDIVQSKSIKKVGEFWYAFGNEITCHRGYYIKTSDAQEIECDYDTRAIWFSFMIDSNNNPIFASLDESGLGGDMIVYSEDMGGSKDDIADVVIFDSNGGKMYYALWEEYTVIDIKEVK